MSEMKRAIIKRVMKLRERVPSPNSRSLNEIFHHPSFTQASRQERERIMLETSERAFLDESQYHSFESCFGLDLAPLLKSKISLDLGCFTGGPAIAWTERYQLEKIYGIDVRDIYIEAAQSFAKRKSVKAEFVCSKGESLPFKSKAFNGVCSIYVLLISYFVIKSYLNFRELLKMVVLLYLMSLVKYSPKDIGGS